MATWNKNGYVIERCTILKNRKLLEPVDRKILTPNPIMIDEKSNTNNLIEGVFSLSALFLTGCSPALPRYASSRSLKDRKWCR
ncbi:MAG: hypothetical protein IKQ46_11400 [Bacteroidales bacterium]|nr:hypothetical protein [Bacteroidales bacterium]